LGDGYHTETSDEFFGPRIQWLVIGHGENMSTFNIRGRFDKFLLRGLTPGEWYIGRVIGIAFDDKLRQWKSDTSGPRLGALRR
jgi:hypothetical protein